MKRRKGAPGRQLEQYLDRYCGHLRAIGAGFMFKVPEPTRNVRGKGLIYAKAVFCDYAGSLKGGIGLVGEAKELRDDEKDLPLGYIRPIQREVMPETSALGVPTWLYVRRVMSNKSIEDYLIPVLEDTFSGGPIRLDDEYKRSGR